MSDVSVETMSSCNSSQHYPQHHFLDDHDDPTRDNVEDDPIICYLESCLRQRDGDPKKVADLLVDTAQGNESSSVHSWILNTMMDMCQGGTSKFKAEYKQRFMQRDTPKLIVDIMRQHESVCSIQGQACSALRILAAKSDVNRPKIVNAGVTEALVMALELHIQSDVVVRNALACLRVLSKENQCRAELQSSLPQLIPNVMCLHREVPGIQRDACAVLSNAAVDVVTQTVNAVPEAVLDGIIQAMAAHIDDASVLSIACFGLKNFTCNPENLKHLVEIGGLETVELAASVGEDFVPNANVVVSRLRSVLPEPDSDGNSSISSIFDSMSDAGQDSISDILDVMDANEDSAKTAAAGLQGIQTLAMDPTQRGKINSALLMKVLAIVRRHAEDPSVQSSGLEILAAMAGEQGTYRETILSAQGLSTIMAALERHSSSLEVQVAGTSALSVLSSEFECWFELEQAGKAGFVYSIVESFPQSMRIQEDASEILLNFSIHSSLG